MSDRDVRVEFVDAIQERYSAIPEAIRANREVLSLFLPMLRADFALLDGYRYRDEPPLDVPLTALLGAQDRVEVEADLLAWGEHGRPFEFRSVPGGHFFHREDPDLVTGTVGGLLRGVC